MQSNETGTGLALCPSEREFLAEQGPARIGLSQLPIMREVKPVIASYGGRKNPQKFLWPFVEQMSIAAME